MTDEERWRIQGRTRDELKRTKEIVATLRSDIDEYAKQLKAVADSLASFLSDPTGRGPTGMLKDEYLIHFHHQLLTREIERQLSEFVKASERQKELEKQVAEFGN